MSEKTVKIEITVPIELRRFVEALEKFSGLDMNEYLLRCLTQGVLDGLKSDCEGVKVVDAEAYHTIKEKYDLDGLCEKVMDP